MKEKWKNSHPPEKSKSILRTVFHSNVNLNESIENVDFASNSSCQTVIGNKMALIFLFSLASL